MLYTKNTEQLSCDGAKSKVAAKYGCNNVMQPNSKGNFIYIWYYPKYCCECILCQINRYAHTVLWCAKRYQLGLSDA